MRHISVVLTIFPNVLHYLPSNLLITPFCRRSRDDIYCMNKGVLPPNYNDAIKSDGELFVYFLFHSVVSVKVN